MSADRRSNAVFLEVPGRTAASACPGCQATIYWVRTAASQLVPIDCDVDGGLRPSRSTALSGGVQYNPGRGVSHAVTCPVERAGRSNA